MPHNWLGFLWKGKKKPVNQVMSEILKKLQNTLEAIKEIKLSCGRLSHGLITCWEGRIV